MESKIKVQILLITLLILSYFKLACSKNIFCQQTIDLNEEPIDFRSRSLFGLINIEQESLTCEVVINVPKDFYGIRIDFVDVAMDGPSIYADQNSPGHCECDMFFLKGFKSWTPPARCGSLKGYSFLIDKDAEFHRNQLKLVALMSTSSYSWHIRITQIFQPPKVNLGLSGSNKPLVSQHNQSMMTSKAVSHGVSTSPLQVPYLVSIRRNDALAYAKTSNCSDVFNEKVTICGGSIIGDRFILTSASCFYQTRKYLPRNAIHELEVVAGDTNVCKEEGLDEEFQVAYYKIRNIVYHYGFDRHLHLHDIAVVVLESPIQFVDHIQPIKLSREDDRTKPLRGVISGFGTWDLETEGYYVNKTTFTGLEKPTWFLPYGSQSTQLTLNPSKDCSFTKINTKYKELYGQMPFTDIKKYAHVPQSIRCAIIDKKKQKISPRGSMGSPGFRDKGGPFVTFGKEQNSSPRLSGIILKPSQNPWKVVKGEELFLSVPYYRNWIKSVVASYQ